MRTGSVIISFIVWNNAVIIGVKALTTVAIPSKNNVINGPIRFIISPKPINTFIRMSPITPPSDSIIPVINSNALPSPAIISKTLNAAASPAANIGSEIAITATPTITIGLANAASPLAKPVRKP